MIRAGEIDYRAGQLVTHYRETEDGVEVHARNLTTGAEEIHRAHHLLLGAGALNTARIVLESNRDYETRLPVLDNPMACIPFFQLSRVGSALATEDTSLAQLNLIVEDDEWSAPLQASLYGTTGPLRSDIVFSLAPLVPRESRVDQIPRARHGPADALLSRPRERIELRAPAAFRRTRSRIRARAAARHRAPSDPPAA